MLCVPPCLACPSGSSSKSPLRLSSLACSSHFSIGIPTLYLSPHCNPLLQCCTALCRAHTHALRCGCHLLVPLFRGTLISLVAAYDSSMQLLMVMRCCKACTPCCVPSCCLLFLPPSPNFCPVAAIMAAPQLSSCTPSVCAVASVSVSDTILTHLCCAPCCAVCCAQLLGRCLAASHAVIDRLEFLLAESEGSLEAEGSRAAEGSGEAEWPAAEGPQTSAACAQQGAPSMSEPEARNPKGQEGDWEVMYTIQHGRVHLPCCHGGNGGDGTAFLLETEESGEAEGPEPGSLDANGSRGAGRSVAEWSGAGGLGTGRLGAEGPGAEGAWDPGLTHRLSSVVVASRARFAAQHPRFEAWRRLHSTHSGARGSE